MAKNENSTSTLVLSEVRECLNAIEKYLIYLNSTDFYQVTSDSKWMRALLSQNIIDIISKKDGELDNSEVSNFMKLNVRAGSHKINNKLHALYKEFSRNNFKAVQDEECHIKIVLSRGAYLKGLGTVPKTEKTKYGSKLCKSYIEPLGKIVGVTDEGELLADEIKTHLIEELGNSINEFCLHNKDDGYPLQKKIDSFKLLTAIIVTSLNYKTVEKDEDEGGLYDSLSLYIKEYLESSIKETGNGITSDDNNTLTTKITSKATREEVHEQNNDFENVILNRIINNNDVIEIDAQTYDISLLIESYFWNIIRNAQKSNQVLSFREYEIIVENIARDIRKKILGLKNSISVKDDLSEVKIAALEFLTFFLLFQVAQALLDYSEHLLKEANDAIRKETLRNTKLRFEKRREMYEIKAEEKRSELSESINTALNKRDLNNPLV